MSRAFGGWGKRNTDVHGQEVFCAGRGCGMCEGRLGLFLFLLQRYTLLPGSEHLVERVDADSRPVHVTQRWVAPPVTRNLFLSLMQSCFDLLDAVDPLVLLFGRGGRDAIHHVVPFHHSPIRLRLAGFYQLSTVVGDVQLEAVLERKRSALITGCSKCWTYFGSEKWNLTGFLGSSTSRMLRFSNGMIPRGSLSCKIKGFRAAVNCCYLNYMLNMLNKGLFYHNAEPKVDRPDVI